MQTPAAVFAVNDIHVICVSGPLVTLNKPQGLPVTGKGRGRRCTGRRFDVSEEGYNEEKGMVG